MRTKTASARKNEPLASLVVTIEKGRLRINGDLPLRWILLVIGAVATAYGSPTVVEAVKMLLRAR